MKTRSVRAPTPWVPMPTTEQVEANFGFVYRVTNLVSGRKYIGRKQFFTTTNITPHLKRRKMVRDKSSDWRCYEGSSKSLGFDITALGKENFKFEIISFCKDLKHLKYEEVREIILHDALTIKLSDGTPAFYNCGLDAIRYRL